MDEIRRQKNVINMMSTMHSILRTRYYSLALVVELSLLVSAIVLNALVFIDFDYLKLFFEDERVAQGYVGLFSVIVFIISVIMLRVNWKEKSENHSHACTQLSRLLSECRQIMSIREGSEKKIAEDAFSVKYNQISNMLVPIPHSKFNSLKAKHYRKVQLSKLIDRHPGKPLFVLRFYLLFEEARKADG